VPDKDQRVFSIFSLKGGVGKTTIAHALATGLTKDGKRVAFLDADYSNPVAHLLFDIPHQRHKPLADFGIAPVHLNGLQYASVAFLFSSTGASRQSAERRAQVLSDMCSAVRWDPFEYLVVDMAPSSTEENKTVLAALDPQVIIVAERGPLAERGLERSVKFLKAARAQVLGVVGNKGFDARNLAKEYNVPYLMTLPIAEDVSLDPQVFLKASPLRMGRISLKQRGKRHLLRASLETYVKVREWRS
jgi:Mrp family chromosome partitioning ATPase